MEAGGYGGFPKEDEVMPLIGFLQWKRPMKYPILGSRTPVTGNGYTGSKQKVKLDIPIEDPKSRHRKGKK